jgi:hypothetical protein
MFYFNHERHGLVPSCYYFCFPLTVNIFKIKSFSSFSLGHTWTSRGESCPTFFGVTVVLWHATSHWGFHNQLSVHRGQFTEFVHFHVIHPWDPRTSYTHYPCQLARIQLLPHWVRSYHSPTDSATVPSCSPLLRTLGFQVCLLHSYHLVVSVLHFWRISPKFTSLKILVFLLGSQFAFRRHCVLYNKHIAFFF